MELQNLINAYRETALLQKEAIQKEDTATFNKLMEKLESLLKETEKTSEGRMALRRFLDDSDEYIQFCAARDLYLSSLVSDEMLNRIKMIASGSKDPVAAFEANAFSLIAQDVIVRK